MRRELLDVLLAADAEVVGRGAAQVAVVQVAELDGGGLVVPHAALGLGAAPLPRPPSGVATCAQVDEPGDVGRGQQATVGGVLKCLGQQGAFGAPAVDGEGDDAQEGREHQRAVDDEEVPRARQGRGVPEAVQEGRDREAGERRQEPHPQAPRGDRESDADADEDGEEGVRERADHAAQDEGAGQRRGAAGAEAVGPVVGGGEVEDVLGEGEPDADHAGVDDAVEHAVELVATPPQEQQEERALGRLLGDRGDHGQAVALAGAADQADALEDQRGRRRDEGTPEQAGDQEVARLGLVAVQPHEAADQRPHRHGRQHGGEGERAGCAGQADDQRHGQAAEEDEDAHHDGEGDTVATASVHGSTLTERPAPPAFPHPLGRKVRACLRRAFVVQ